MPYPNKRMNIFIMYISPDCMRCVVTNTQRVCPAYEMKTSVTHTDTSTAPDAVKSSISAKRSLNNTQFGLLSSATPESTNVHSTKQVYSTPSIGESLPRILNLKKELLTDVEVVQYSPQSMFAFTSLFNLEAAMRDKLTGAAISKIEGLMALYLALSDVQTSTGFAAVLTLYAKTHSQTALTSQLKDITKKLFDSYVPQASDEPSKNKRPKWLDDMISGLSNWKLLINSPSFTQISRVISLLITLGVLDSCSASLGNFEIFAVQAQTKHANAVDLADALVETITYFAEGAYQCFEQGSVRPLLFSSSQLVKIEERYIAKQTEFEFVRNGNLEKFGKKSEAIFDKELKELITELHELYKTMPNGAEKKIIQLKWEKLAKMDAEYTALRVAGGLRKAPFCVKIYGNSGVGKSTFADITMAAVLKAAGAPCTSEFVMTLNEKEKYMSTFKSFVTGIKIDDYGNTKADFWECAPSDWVIKICNNIREAAIMADVASKGKMSIEPLCLTITTNVEHLHAGVTSNNAMSVLRRCHIHVELNVRPEFMTDNMLDTDKVKQKFGKLDKVHDIWLVTIKQPIGDGPGKQNFNGWKIIKTDISVHEYLNYVIAASIKHNNEQEDIVKSFKEPSELIQICKDCSRLTSTCTCDFVPHYGERLATALAHKAGEVNLDFQKIRCNAETKIEDVSVDILLDSYKFFEESPYSSWTSWIPEQFMDNNHVRSAILYAGKDIIGQSVKQYINNFALTALFIICCMTKIHAIFFLPTLLMCSMYGTVCYAGVVEAKKNAYLDELVNTRSVLNKTFISARDKHVKYACGTFAGLALLYSAAKLYQALRSSITMQGSLNPMSIADIQERNSEANPWQTSPLQPTKVAKFFGNLQEAENAVYKSMCQIQCADQFSGAFVVKTNIIAIPHHFLPKEVIEAKLMYGKRHIRFILNPALTQRVGDLDLVLVFVPNTGPLPDNTRRFMTDYAHQPMISTMYGLNQDCTRFNSRLMWQFASAVHNGHCAFNGAHYTLTGMNTFAGQCMSPIIHEGDRKCIIGFHIGGRTGTPNGCGMAVLSSELTQSIVKLLSISKNFVAGPQSQAVKDVVANRQIAISSDIHKRCPTNYIDPTGSIEVFGTVTGRSSHISNVVQTPISEHVTAVTGVPNKWGAPKFKQPKELPNGAIDSQSWMPWHTSLAVCSQPSIGFDPLVVDFATADYLSGLKVKYDTQRDMWEEDIKPLDRLEVVSGVDGKRFIDAMKQSTSMGYPIGGPKTAFLIDLEPTEERSCPRTFTPEIWALVDELEEMADNGLSLNQIFGANLKDEPTLLTKDKVRVFQAAPIALQLLIRKYFLSIARFLSFNALAAENAVGINCDGPEWNELVNFMAMHGPDRVIAGDYSKYDLRMPEQLTLAAFSVMIEIAKWSGNYTPIDINRMTVIAHEVCSPLIAYNGTLMRFMGTNPSGQNMTVYINGIVNSLLHRIAFDDVYDLEARIQMGKVLGLGRPAEFRDIVALMTYGDDAKGSVMVGYDDFNHVSMADFLARHDMKFTMPDKESEPIPFMSRFSADFLKRQDRFEPDLGVYVGQLAEDSIWKSLHSINKSKVVTPTEVSAMNIAGALREWFFHGREVFEMRLEQMKEVAALANLPVPELMISYDDRVVLWKDKYESQI